MLLNTGIPKLCYVIVTFMYLFKKYKDFPKKDFVSPITLLRLGYVRK